MSDTFAKLQTPPGRGGIAVICLRGPQTAKVLKAVFQPMKSHAKGGQGLLQLGHIIRNEQIIDEAVVHNRLNAAEINIHGGPIVVRETLNLLAEHGAEIMPSEQVDDSFQTSHPLWNNPAIGAEMLAALPLAKSLLAAAAITQQWSAGLSQLLRGADLPNAAILHKAVDNFSITDRLLRPAEVVLGGPPNAGKSTLMNELVGRQVSIVHDTAGTTRDWVRELAVFNGVPVWLTDTAGLWEAAAEIDAEAVRRAHQKISHADIVLLLSDGKQIDAPTWCAPEKIIRIASKCDACDAAGNFDVAVSVHAGRGLDELRQAVLRTLGLPENINPAAPAAFTSRQLMLLRQAASAIETNDLHRYHAAARQILEG